MIFRLNIHLDKKLDTDTFEKATRRQYNQTELRFINFYKCEFDSDTLVGGLIFGFRTPTSLHGKSSVHIHQTIKVQFEE